MFTHLHLHTEFSLLDATIKIDDLIEKLKSSNMTSCAITDHGNMYGVYKFKTYMEDAGLKPILGCEIYVAPRGMEDKEHGIDNKYFHLVLLAKNLEGYKNLVKIVSIAHMEGFYYKPRIDFETLAKYSEGIIALSACLAGPISRPLLNNQPAEALNTAKKYAEVFKDNFYIEIQRNGMEEQKGVNEGLLKIAKELKLPIVATCDSHYINKEDAEIQEVLWCINDGKEWDDPTRRTMPTNEFYVKTPEEMELLFEDFPQAIENTQKIVDSIEDYDITWGRVEPHTLDLPKKETAKSYLKKLTLQGAKKKYGKVTKDLKKRIEYELEVIDSKRYNDYFLVVRDFVLYCRNNDIVVGMRGSGCGSVVAYCIEITDIEPIGWELYFERFLNPERNSPPDFDIDIADKGRDKLIQYTIDRYGKENVKQIITFGKLQTRQAIRDVARVIGIDLSIADQLSKQVEIVFGKAKGIDYMIENNPEFAEIIHSSPDTERLAEIVRKVAGIHRNVGTHACGIVITPSPVIEYCPIQRDAHGEGFGMTQFEMKDVEPIGLMKFDFLGLRNLNVIGAAIKKVEANRGKKIVLGGLDPHDKKTFQVIRSGHTVGVFQMESSGMRSTIKALKPTTQEDLCYILAAYRPGPMKYISEYVAVKEGKQDPDYVFKELEDVLKITNGVITYQEQVMKIAQIIGGYTLGGADILRRAMGKKLIDVMEAEKPVFMKGAKQQGYDLVEVERLWSKLLQFANYGFNKAHSASYATISYWTAYLKAHYPLEFMAALLEGDLDNFERIIIDLKECERLGIDVLSPTINKSNLYFSIEDDKDIRFGLGAIKNVGEDVIRDIVKERKENGEYTSLDDLIYRLIDKKLSKKAVEYLIKAGTMDEFGERGALIVLLEAVYENAKKESKIFSAGQMDIFSMGNDPKEQKRRIVQATPLPQIEKTPVAQILQWEKELLGLYFSSHPLDNLQEFFESKEVINIDQALEKKDGTLVILGVLISKVRRITTKKGAMMAFLSAEDKSGSTDVIVFPRTYRDMKEVLEEGKPMLLVGRVNDRNGEKGVILEKAKYINEEKFGSNFEGVIFRIRGSHSAEVIKALKKYISTSEGDTAVKIILNTDGETTTKVLEKKIAMNSETKRWLRKF
ncbi:DNA polymerase III subunit alpha [bacterium]|nr:DNA polymerase III subunit alpha [bacterium]